MLAFVGNTNKDKRVELTWLTDEVFLAENIFFKRVSGKGRKTVYACRKRHVSIKMYPRTKWVLKTFIDCNNSDCRKLQGIKFWPKLGTNVSKGIGSHGGKIFYGGNYQYWAYKNILRCTRFKTKPNPCKCRVQINNGSIKHVFAAHNHEGEVNEDLIKRRIAKNQLRLAMLKSINESGIGWAKEKWVFDKWSQTSIINGDDLWLCFSGFEDARATLEYAKWKICPILPNDISSLLQVLEKVVTVVNKQPLFRERTPCGCLVFQSISGSKRLVKAKVIISDGTFPKINLEFIGLAGEKNKFYQLLTIQSILSPRNDREGQEIMLDSIILMPDKKRATYDEAYSAAVRIALTDCKCETFGMKRVLTDAEYNLRQSACLHFRAPKCSVCMFHRAQALWKNLAKHNLSELYKERTPKGLAFRILFADLVLLCFLPVEIIAQTQANLFNVFRRFYLRSTYAHHITTYQGYNERIWLKKIKPEDWNYCKDPDNRTTNLVERWNRHAKERLGYRSNFFVFLNFVIDEDLSHYMKECRIKKFGVHKKMRKRKFRNRDQDLLEVITKWKNGEVLMNDPQLTHMKVTQYLKELREAYNPDRYIS